MKKIFIGALVALFFAQCSTRQNSENILTRARMVSILTDIHILEAKVQQLPAVDPDSSRKIYNTLELRIFEKHGVTKQIYEESFAYYAARPVEFGAIYTTVVDSLNLREQQMGVYLAKQRELEELAELARMDSINRADSIQRLADTLGISFDSLLFLSDSLGYNMDSLVLRDTLKVIPDFMRGTLVQHQDTLSGDSIKQEKEKK